MNLIGRHVLQMCHIHTTVTSIISIILKAALHTVIFQVIGDPRILDLTQFAYLVIEKLASDCFMYKV